MAKPTRPSSTMDRVQLRRCPGELWAPPSGSAPTTTCPYAKAWDDLADVEINEEKGLGHVIAWNERILRHALEYSRGSSSLPEHYVLQSTSTDHTCTKVAQIPDVTETHTLNHVMWLDEVLDRNLLVGVAKLASWCNDQKLLSQLFPPCQFALNVLRHLGWLCEKAGTQYGYIQNEEVIACCFSRAIGSSALQVAIMPLPLSLHGDGVLTSDMAPWWMCFLGMSKPQNRRLVPTREMVRVNNIPIANALPTRFLQTSRGPSETMPSVIAIAIGAAATTYVFLVALLRMTQDAKEPPSICDAVPLDKYNLPIYTLRMPGSRLYVVNATSRITSVQSEFRKLSFAAIEANIAAHLIGVNEATNKIISADATSDSSCLMSFPKYVHSALSPGSGLDAMNRRSIEVISDSLEQTVQRGSKTLKLFEWVRHELLVASNEGVYGPKNPFRDPAMERAWFAFEPGMMMFVLRLMPQVSAKESFQAREYMVKVWEDYFEKGFYNQGSELIKTRVRINNDFQISLKETARIEIGGSLAILTNTLPGTFWMIYHIFSDPVVLGEIRDELSKGVHQYGNTCSIDLSFVKSSCPILLSTFKETMRIHSSSVATRIAMEDYLLDDKYLLKKGSTIMMPSSVQDTSRPIWGDTVDDFNHRRFLRDSGTKRINPLAFQGFGGGATPCPGRHFASTEILVFSALMVLRFDLVPLKDWTRPSTAKSPMVNALSVPDWDIDVEMNPRNRKVWNVSLSGYDKKMEIVSEDIASTAQQH
ncbi:hypothetical protein S7711_04651 [Stachybotrys chartarum IBT 7711]|uniref:Uncharacterized protein n=1 Tax=Stachybotrys chartarum (strain CBS 109288 / IBT 7711) TaxID=1280523 RepID=A0A084B5Z9_STACB|nr:hypothetical protein S7711_04651 [Stachybotrys chartarum IBT 7711]